jgi:hypothetical protein
MKKAPHWPPLIIRGYCKQSIRHGNISVGTFVTLKTPTCKPLKFPAKQHRSLLRHSSVTYVNQPQCSAVAICVNREATHMEVDAWQLEKNVQSVNQRILSLLPSYIQLKFLGSSLFTAISSPFPVLTYIAFRCAAPWRRDNDGCHKGLEW